jgi:hypothetical protein
MVLSLQSRATHRRNRGVILRRARESETKKQEACQFGGGSREQAILSQAGPGNPAAEGVSLTDSADTQEPECRVGCFSSTNDHENSVMILNSSLFLREYCPQNRHFALFMCNTV